MSYRNQFISTTTWTIKLRRTLSATLIIACLPVGTQTVAGEGGVARFSKQMADSVSPSLDLAPITLTWRYHPGDDKSWADPAFDDSGWELAQTTLPRDTMPPRVGAESAGSD